MNQQNKLQQLQHALKTCRDCKDMFGPPVVGMPNISPVMLIGQAPGNKEIEVHRPFAWTAGKTLFKWFSQIGLDETDFRQKVYMSAVCRCFPGKKPKGGDRVPSKMEIETCQQWVNRELSLVQPQLIIPVGKLAINNFIKIGKLTDIVGTQSTIEFNDQTIDMIALPHPSGASTWYYTEPGKTLLLKALKMIQSHSAWKKITSK
jgi:uracil-DNA glycosylase